MRNWKTTLIGLITALAGFVAASPQLFIAYPFLIEVAKYITIGGLAGLGFVSKDYNTSGTGKK